MSTALTLGYGLNGGLGNLDAYITSANKVPALSAEEELALATRLRDEGDVAAAHRLVVSHLRVVIAVARGYLGYGLPLADLIQEGNVGLMRAVKRYDPLRGVRLVSYAAYWIKATIHEYILKNWRLVKMSNSHAQRKLFFGLRSQQNAIEQIEGRVASTRDLASSLAVSEDDVRTMQQRFAATEVSYDAPAGEENDEVYAPAHYLSSSDDEPTQQMARAAYDVLQTSGLQSALEVLDSRSRRVIEARWLREKGEGTAPMTLSELAQELSISIERVRQIEVAALKKMRSALQPYHALVTEH